MSELPRHSISTRRASVSPTNEARRSGSVHSSLGTMQPRDSVTKDAKPAVTLAENVALTEEEVNDINLVRAFLVLFMLSVLSEP